MNISRLLRHLILPDWWLMRSFPAAALGEIEKAIGLSETRHQGELRFVVEAGLPIESLRSGQSAHERAVDLFAQLKVWDTEYNSGVLIYLQLIDHRVEIVADRGIHARVGQAFWDQVCRDMELAFHAGRFTAGALAAISAITEELARHFPAGQNNQNELPDAVVVL